MQASAITQDYLDEVAACVMADNWEAYCDTLCWPFTLVTHTSTMTFAKPEDIRGVYNDFGLLLRTQRVSDYVRLVEVAHQIDESLISARYVTHLMAGSHRIMDPVRSGISLRLEGDRWRAASITNAVSNSRWQLLMPKPGEETQ